MSEQNLMLRQVKLFRLFLIFIFLSCCIFAIIILVFFFKKLVQLNLTIVAVSLQTLGILVPKLSINNQQIFFIQL